MRQVFSLLLKDKKFVLKRKPASYEPLTNGYVYVQKHTYENENHLVVDRTYSPRSALYSRTSISKFEEICFPL